MKKSDFSTPHFDGGGRFSSSGPWIHGHRVIESYELIIVTKGTVWIAEGEQEFTLCPNDYILLHPNIPHGGWRTSVEPVEFYWLHFFSAENQRFENPYFGTLKSPSVLIQTARQLLQIKQSPDYPPETCDHLLFVLLAELNVQRQQQAPLNALAARVHEYIRARADLPLTATQVADEIGYHPDYLSRVLKNCYGFTLQQVITYQRLSRAKLLLQTTDFTVARIALELGYKEPNLFEKFFRYHQGTTPTAYRNSFSKIHTNHK